jgi:hypothetical protein
MMEAARTSETSVDNHFTRQYNPEDSSEHQLFTLQKQYTEQDKEKKCEENRDMLLLFCDFFLPFNLHIQSVSEL